MKHGLTKMGSLRVKKTNDERSAINSDYKGEKKYGNNRASCSK